ncbi:gamma carbonic anhydrase family protein [Corynebacterium terpenotabidum]|uniref:Gamma-type carbonic anhydratase-like protein n=1 Tax=Corynebacterium terpenotabidum Y-11 TaxID=1200352 RepID=S4XFB8_9CORY|nr:gamma carbonic anhydrase family protein [Corynebacterium terpenotabidum]AGP31827.1 gamma-type carbonic anhydratase-like protein [Corynebacterium terpenotabidum Y-11]
MSTSRSPRTSGPLILPFNGVAPRIHRSAYIAPDAVIVGDVLIDEDASVFYGVVVRADVGSIRIGKRTNIQDNSVVHTEAGSPTVIGDDVTVGHQALVHACTIGDGTLVGMQSALLSRSTIGSGCIIGGGAVVLEGQEIPPGTLAAGLPAKVRRELSAEEQEHLITHAAKYVDLARTQAAPEDALSLDEVHFS